MQQAEYQVVVLVGGLNSRKAFASFATTTNPDDISALPFLIEDAIKEYEEGIDNYEG